MLTIGSEFSAWCIDDKDNVTEYNRMSYGTHIALMNAVESGNLVKAAHGILSVTEVKQHVMHQLMSSTNAAISSTNLRKVGKVSYLMKKDAAAMKKFSWL